MHVHVYIPIHLLQAHNTIPQTGSLTNITTEILAYGFYYNQAMAHKSVSLCTDLHILKKSRAVAKHHC